MCHCCDVLISNIEIPYRYGFTSGLAPPPPPLPTPAGMGQRGCRIGANLIITSKLEKLCKEIST